MVRSKNWTVLSENLANELSYFPMLVSKPPACPSGRVMTIPHQPFMTEE